MLTTLLFSCDDILEENITDDIVQTSSPSEGVTIDGNTVQFSWFVLDGADDYRIQIIKGSQVVEVDSLITTNTFNYILNPGNYQWQVRGENFAYSTAYTFPVNFSVKISDDLSNQKVSLLTPSIDFYTNNANLTCTWEKFTTATSYNFELIKNLSGEQTVLQQPDLSTNSYTIDASKFDEDAKYIWKVKALNATSETETVFSQRSIFIDRVAPNQPVLTLPADQGTTTTKTVTFSWTNGTDSGNVKSTITYTIEVASDINFNTTIHSAKITTNTYQYTFVTAGTYHWRVKAIDKATNASDYSIARSVVVQ
ncbi:hypothetical protein QLS71_007945 [Mariniflexile litorale]|uniref:Fibronectin type-III domain-containing protein n=1 Tax=Mariniflexile litorale TaxID=3045158 RepID=A0AAU7ELE7_9FLAO|nr:hypothetical protein [Mariniflexile sp. KMM 9835]MDQ8213264.1 hypothetical protein [Mariniflexile sp. KMM 9835]